MGGVGNFQNLSKLGRGGANKLKWVKKIENSVIDLPSTIRDGRVKHLACECILGGRDNPLLYVHFSNIQELLLSTNISVYDSHLHC